MSRLIRITALVGFACLAVSSSAPSANAASVGAAPDGTVGPTSWQLDARHGDHGHGHKDLREIQVGETEHMQAHLAAPIVAASGELVPVVPWRGNGGHHHDGHAAAKIELDEQALYDVAGPAPLSYVEWDFRFSAGRDGEIVRFTQNAGMNDTKLMGQVDGAWRTLFDEGSESRKQLEKDLQSRIGKDGRAPRHSGLMLLHITGSTFSCCLLLPVALVLKAGHSSLAPLFSLIYLLALSASLFVSWLYKALTPQLYPKNAHGGLGYAVFWLSVIGLGGDVSRLIVQAWMAIKPKRFSALANPGRSSAEMRTNWSNALHVALGQYMSFDADKQAALMEEEELMLQAGEVIGESDAKEIEVAFENFSHAATGRTSPPRSVHFEDDETVHDAEAGFIPSPSGALVNIPRGSSFGEWTHSKIPWLHSDAPLSSSPRSPRAQMSRLASETATPVASSSASTSRLQQLRMTLRFAHVVLNRALPVLAFATGYVGIAVYSGSCRSGKAPGCAAHGIKGAIFFWYGLLTWCRYLGAYSDIGWAWNKKPSPMSTKRSGVASWRQNAVSAEFVESAVIFTYGVTNTWMERFSAAPGSPYTVKEIQHISIAVMFWFAGLVGMLLETKRVRDLLSFGASLHHPAARPMRSRSSASSNIDEAHILVDSQAPPPSYVASFNPFPALVIGVTGIAMAAHHQDYEYEVQVHSLWGNLLGGFAVLRCFTYFFMWLRPPTSILPSRPPTEAMASFSLACGGFVFMLSTEEVSFMQMRTGYDDMMALLNLTVAVVALVFCLAALLMVLKNWALRREWRLTQQHVARGSFGLKEATGERIRLESMEEQRWSPYGDYHAPHGRRLHARVAESEPIFSLGDDELGEQHPDALDEHAHGRRFTFGLQPAVSGCIRVGTARENLTASSHTGIRNTSHLLVK
ncbi:hypothetical protein K437DRAFT_256120 [Tilletiaria anomala UBC 951]|uniref:Protein YTP1-like C-terminal domain-containing protein n=1 Tax=Tilletiaria anomala (strain ATCC 24038 / CBS 436.72 / UBC 951) TaxID=1037660 RepID=A0A066W230_TILAU|nr:uncharacterized protein K437DRAFT_256120 [Tilletiaria anomala UBC 951]KDN46613.1 hypothetical protein K437DRAFT_256120 [Tilletiaria anomala UBC 951]